METVVFATTSSKKTRAKTAARVKDVLTEWKTRHFYFTDTPRCNLRAGPYYIDARGTFHMVGQEVYDDSHAFALGCTMLNRSVSTPSIRIPEGGVDNLQPLGRFRPVLGSLENLGFSPRVAAPWAAKRRKIHHASEAHSH